MALADAALAILRYVIFRPVAPAMALAAMIFRLIQSVLIAGNLMNMQAAWLLLTGDAGLSGLPAEQAEAMVLHALTLHAHGYDLGLIFFGVNSLLTGLLIWRSGFFTRGVGAGVAIAGLVYLVGSGLRFLAPGLFDIFAPAYALTVLAETAFCVTLLLANRSSRRSITA
jgi:hypothetical protein